MKTIGLIGGMSWQSTRVYYDLLNEAVAAARGGLHSAEILMRSVDFAGLEAAMRRGDWSEANRVISIFISWMIWPLVVQKGLFLAAPRSRCW